MTEEGQNSITVTFGGPKDDWVNISNLEDNARCERVYKNVRTNEVKRFRLYESSRVPSGVGAIEVTVFDEARVHKKTEAIVDGISTSIQAIVAILEEA